MLEVFKKNSFLQSIPQRIKRPLLFEGLWDVPKALLALAAKRSVLLITGEALFEDLSFFAQKSPLVFPAWETLPGEDITPSPDIVGKRYEILQTLSQKGPHIVLASLQACLQRVSSPEHLAPLFHQWKVGDELDFGSLPKLLLELGYVQRPIASDKGEFAVRGGIIDVFPVSSLDPYRIDFFGDTIDDIRIYDPIGQKSVEKRSELFLSPAGELDRVQKDHSATLLDYMDEPLVIFDDLLAIENRYVTLRSLPGAQSPLFMPFEEFMRRIETLPKMYWSNEAITDLATIEKQGDMVSFEIFDHTLKVERAIHPFFTIEEAFGDLDGVLAQSRNPDLHFITSSEAEESALRSRIHAPLPKATTFHKGYLSRGLFMKDSNTILFPYTELSGRKRVTRTPWRHSYHTPASEFHQLEPGDLVVHYHNGIGKYLGIEKQKNHEGNEVEFFIIEYDGGSKLYTPLSQSHLVSRYIGSHEETPQLSKLGSKQWTVTREKTAQSIIGYAKDLLKLQAEREAKGGFIYPPDGLDVQLFEAEFPFEETEDQVRAISDIKNDMQSKKAMDRLICGDVGYGKTEVAMRAACKAIVDGGKQVAVLVPTTVLATQHYETFVERMAEFPITIGLASRFVTAKEVKKTLLGVKEGSVDVLVGTHRILGKDVSFHNLGLIIIDEEQRFGVRAKEKLKALKVGVDCLTLSATPIPRTLHFSLAGARDMSVITTPPHDRLPIKTILAERDPEVIKNALLRELAHDGQAYFIHNRVETIYKVAKELEEMLPRARIGIVHGQMDSDGIDTTFHAFKRGEIDILVATTIVENGIDIPNANTILIDRADCYGLASLYQLRGRVGRWNKPAYAYLLTPKNQTLPEISRKRLTALIEASGFGGGIKLAMRDLEIRGAGDLLGVKQSGHVSSVGFHLYCKMLKKAVATMQKSLPVNFYEAKLEAPFPSSLPESYISETSVRLEIYHRLGETTTLEEIDEIIAELTDRFGPYPEEVSWLHHLSRLRLWASSHQIALLKFSAKTLTVKKDAHSHTFTLPPFTTPQELEEKTLAILTKVVS